MKRVAVFALLAVLHLTWPMPGRTQNKGVQYGHQTAKEAQDAAERQQKANEKAARKQLKRAEKYEKKQWKASKKAAKEASKKAPHYGGGGSR